MAYTGDQEEMEYRQSRNNMAYNRNHDSNALDWDHPNSDQWPEVFCEGREQFSETFYQRFPWARGIDPFEESTETPAGEYLKSRREGLPIDLKAEAPPVLAFVKGLISLELDDLPDDEHHCPICREKYREGQHGEMPLEMPCKHVVGKDCLIQWLSSISGIIDEHCHDNCPICRSKLITETKKPLDTIEGLEQFLRDANYVLTAEGPLTLTKPWRLCWDDIKDYVASYLKDAKYERQKKKLRQRIFMRMMRKEISELVWNARTTETIEQTIEFRAKVNRALDKQHKEGIIEAYLEKQAGENSANVDPEWTMEMIMADFEAMPFGLGRLIQNTYTKCVTGGSNFFQGNGEDDMEATFSDFAISGGPRTLDTELKMVRYKNFVDAIRNEIFENMWCSYVTIPQGQEGKARHDVLRAFEDAQQRGIIWTWLEVADMDGPQADESFEPDIDDLSQLVEYIVKNVYKTEFMDSI